jgi:Transposase DDE domain
LSGMNRNVHVPFLGEGKRQRRPLTRLDGGRKRIIVGVLVTPGEVMENQPIRDLLWHVRFRWKLHPRQVTGDTRYGTEENIQGVEDMGIRAYMPLPDWGDKAGYFGLARFRYDAEQDVYRCPEGQLLRFLHHEYTTERVAYRAKAAVCNVCPAKAQCTPSVHGRVVQRSFYAEYVERVRAYHQTPAYEKAMRKRQVWVEPLFAEAKDWHGLRRFRLRRLWRVNGEALLIAAGQNLKRLLAERGWGRRPLPSGAVLAIPTVHIQFVYLIVVPMALQRSGEARLGPDSGVPVELLAAPAA